VDVVLLLERAVAVPIQLATARVGAVEELHETHALFDQAPREDTILRERRLVRILCIVRAIHFQNVRGLGAEVVDLRHAKLHACGEFVAGDAGGELTVAWMRFKG